MKSINKLIVALVILIGTPSFLFAQMDNTVADISLTDVAYRASEENMIEIDFNLKNLSSSPEFDLRYGVEMVLSSDESWGVYDSIVSDEVFGLSSGQSVEKSISYDLKTLAPGTYTAIVKLYNSSGMVLGAGVATGIKASYNDVVSIEASTCYLSVYGDDIKYEIKKGIDVGTDEITTLSCVVKNYGTEVRNVTPQYTQYTRSRFGEMVIINYPAAASVSIEAGDEQVLDFVISYPTKPQAYDFTVVLVDSDSKKIVSNSIDAQYVLRGISATIQKATLDKTFYSKGEEIVTELLWTPSADGFGLDARSTSSSKTGNLDVKVAVSNGKGEACLDTFTSALSNDNVEQRVFLKGSATIDCNKPNLSISIVDSTGNILDSKNFAVDDSMVEQDEEEQEISPVVVSPTKGNSYVPVIAGSLALLAIIIFLIILRKITSKETVIKSILFLVIALSGFGSIGVEKVEAVSFWSACHWSNPGDGNDRCLYFLINANLNKTSFVPSETAALTTTMTNSYCSNNDTVMHYYSYTILNSGGGVVSSGVISNQPYNGAYGTRTVYPVMPSTPGSYIFRPRFSLYNSGGPATTGDIAFTVACPSGTSWNGSACALPPPAAPASITATCPAVGGNPVAVSWATPSGATHYAFRLDYPSDPAPHLVQLDSHVPSSYNSFVPSDGVAYRAWVHACNAGGCSALVSTDFTCRFAPAVTLTASPVLIGEGESSTLTWTATGADTCTASGAWSGVKANTGGSQSVSPMVSSTYNLSCTGSGGTTPVSVTVTMPSGTISATACTIPVAGSSCTSNITWNTQNFRGTPSILQGNAPFSSAVSATAVPRQVNPGDRTFTVKDTGSLYTYGVNAVVNCAANSAWAGGSCMQLPVIDIVSNPNIVRSGNTAPVDISILSNYNLTCDLTGGIQETFTHTASATTQNYTYTTPPLTSARVVHIKCTHDTYSAVTTEDEARIDVIPTVQEV